jgi:hypothetical protein
LGRQGPGQRTHHHPREGHVHRYSLQGENLVMGGCIRIIVIIIGVEKLNNVRKITIERHYQNLST